jgi:hypothetical protein
MCILEGEYSEYRKTLVAKGVPLLDALIAAIRKQSEDICYGPVMPIWYHGQRFQYRDYFTRVYWRYSAMFGGICERRKAYAHFKKRMGKRLYKEKAHWHAPDEYHHEHRSADGDFCPVGPVYDYIHPSGASNHLPQFIEKNCEFCGSPLHLRKQVLPGGEFLPVYGPWSSEYQETHYECSRPGCHREKEFVQDAVRFIERTDYHSRHEVLADKYGVSLSRPLKKYKEAQGAEKLIIAISAMLNFEARCAMKDPEYWKVTRGLT